MFSILFTDYEYEYVLPITQKFKYKYVYIDEESFEEIIQNRRVQSIISNNRSNIINNEIKGYINLSNIYSIPLAYRNELGKLKYDCYINIVSKINDYHKTNTLKQTIEKVTIKKM